MRETVNIITVRITSPMKIFRDEMAISILFLVDWFFGGVTVGDIVGEPQQIIEISTGITGS